MADLALYEYLLERNRIGSALLEQPESDAA
jgi:hypothetical protein